MKSVHSEVRLYESNIENAVDLLQYELAILISDMADETVIGSVFSVPCDAMGGLPVVRPQDPLDNPANSVVAF